MSEMTEYKATPTPEEYFEICAKMLVAAESMREIADRQSEEIRHLIESLRHLK